MENKSKIDNRSVYNDFFRNDKREPVVKLKEIKEFANKFFFERKFNDAHCYYSWALDELLKVKDYNRTDYNQSDLLELQATLRCNIALCCLNLSEDESKLEEDRKEFEKIDKSRLKEENFAKSLLNFNSFYLAIYGKLNIQDALKIKPKNMKYFYINFQLNHRLSNVTELLLNFIERVKDKSLLLPENKEIYEKIVKLLNTKISKIEDVKLMSEALILECECDQIFVTLLMTQIDHICTVKPGAVQEIWGDSEKTQSTIDTDKLYHNLRAGQLQQDLIQNGKSRKIYEKFKDHHNYQIREIAKRFDFFDRLHNDINFEEGKCWCESHDEGVFECGKSRLLDQAHNKMPEVFEKYGQPIFLSFNPK